MSQRRYSLLDQCLMGVDEVLAGTRRARATDSGRANPAAGEQSPELNSEEARRHAAGLMRVNHAGEIAAQALYRGQALTARTPAVRAHMLEAAAEEEDHLRWCEQRLAELGEGPSRLEPLWFAGSYVMGAAAGLAGDDWSLGFVGETERQVSAHLESHLSHLPADDRRSRRIVETMREDEQRHGAEAMAAGGRVLPTPVRQLMRRVAGIMTRSAYWF